MKIIIDVQGFENDPSVAITAARKFQNNHKDVEFVFCGKKNIIEPLIINFNNSSILEANDVITMEDDPINFLRKKESSMYKAIEYVANGNADAVVSAGNSGCYIFGCYSLIKTIKNIDKPAFMSFFPTIKNKPLIFLDTGANKKCEGIDLYKFALMGDVYAKNVFKIKSPKIGVVNIGTEANKGLEFHKVASELINENKNLNYVGFYEPRYILSGDIDVAVCDGYTGNIVVKTLEGSLKTLLNEMKKAFKKPWNLLGALFSIGVFKKLKQTFDYKKYSAAIIIGVNKTCIKTHGNADEEQFSAAIRTAYNYNGSNVIESIKKIK